MPDHQQSMSIPNSSGTPPSPSQVDELSPDDLANLEELLNNDDLGRSVAQYYDLIAAQSFDPLPHDAQCWICYGSRSDDISRDQTAIESQSQSSTDIDHLWVHPCKCRGTTKWVHQDCLQQWIDEKQRGNTTAEVACPQCARPYTILYPPPQILQALLRYIDHRIHRFCPLMTTGICIACLYWGCVTYGAVTVLQIMGPRQGLALMDRTDPLLMLLSLPLVPVGLLMGRLIKWHDPILRMMRSVVPKLPLASYVAPTFAYAPPNNTLARLSEERNSVPRITRMLCGAMALPTIAMSVGNALYVNTIKSSPERVLAGGLTYLAVKGVFKIYYKQNLFVQQCKRRVVNYHEF